MDGPRQDTGDNPISTPGPLIPIHPESIADDERSLRWAVPATTLGFVGVPSRLPTVLQCLLDEGVLESLTVEPSAVRTRIGAGRAWRDHGAEVREALQASLRTPEQWRPADGSEPADDLLRMAVQEVIDGEVGDYIRSHGGAIRLVHAQNDDVVVQLSGACTHCPAAGITLTDRVEGGVRALYPGLRHLTTHNPPAPSAGRRLLRLFPTSTR